MWKNIVEPGRPQMTIRRVLTICNTHIPVQQWLNERESILRYTYASCSVSLVDADLKMGQHLDQDMPASSTKNGIV